VYFLTDSAQKNDVSVTVKEHRRPDGRKSRKRKQSDRAPPAECGGTSSLLELFESLCSFLRRSLSLYMQHVYASHVIRAVLEALSAQRVDDVTVHSQRRLATHCQQQRRSNAGLRSSLSCFSIPGFPRLLESPGFFLENSRTWKVLEKHFGPGKSWKLKIKVLESPGKISLKIMHFYWF